MKKWARRAKKSYSKLELAALDCLIACFGEGSFKWGRFRRSFPFAAAHHAAIGLSFVRLDCGPGDSVRPTFH